MQPKYLVCVAPAIIVLLVLPAASNFLAQSDIIVLSLVLDTAMTVLCVSLAISARRVRRSQFHARVVSTALLEWQNLSHALLARSEIQRACGGSKIVRNATLDTSATESACQRLVAHAILDITAWRVLIPLHLMLLGPRWWKLGDQQVDSAHVVDIVPWGLPSHTRVLLALTIISPGLKARMIVCRVHRGITVPVPIFLIQLDLAQLVISAL